MTLDEKTLFRTICEATVDADVDTVDRVLTAAHVFFNSHMIESALTAAQADGMPRPRTA